MPYKVFEESGKFKVYKLGTDNKKMGKALGTHADKDKAMAQMKAMYASENKKEETVIIGEGTSITAGTATGPTTTTTATTTKAYNDDGMWEPDPVKVEVVESHQSMAVSFAELMAQAESEELHEVMCNLNHSFKALATNIMASEMLEDKAQALTNLAVEYQEMMSTYVKSPEEAPEMPEDMEDKAVKVGKQIAGDNQPAKEKEELPPLMIWKENGVYRWIAAYSNNQRDKESEIITSDSHKEFDQALLNKEWPMPQLWLWHIPYPVGQTEYHVYDESTGYPVAAGTFYKEMDWAAEGLIEANWTAISHGMPDKWIQRKDEDSTLIVRHRTKEISFLPQWAAANKNTVSFILKETNMADELQKGLPAHKRPEFVAAFGEERVKQIEAALTSKSKEVQEQGIETKEVTKEPTMAEVVKALEFLTTEIVTIKQEMATKEVVKEEEPFDLVTRLKSLSVVGQETTKVDGRTKEAKDGPEEARGVSPSQEIAGLPVSLVDKIFQANQAYYNGGKGG